MKLFDVLLTIGLTKESDIHKTRLTRQVNGLNSFFTVVAFSVMVLSIFLYNAYHSTGILFMAILQAIATIFYASNLIFTKRGHLTRTRVVTIHVFEWHLFLCGMLLGGWRNPVIPVVTLFPLLAVLVEVSIRRHLFIALFQVSLLILLHTVFYTDEIYLKNFLNIQENVSFFLDIMGYVYFPVMAAVIINIIYKENVLAREKQKQLLNQITFANKQLEIYTERLKDESQKLQAEVNIAKKIQTMVLPGRSEISEIEELDFSCVMRPAEEVGGDYYDIIKIDDTVTIGIGDVTGHGLSSGLIMMMAQTTIRSFAQLKVTDLKQFLLLVNNVLYANINRIKENRSMTLIILTYEKGKFVIAGQHESYIIIRANGTVEDYDTQNMGFYVGLVPDISDSVNQQEFSLYKDDLLILYTDGITEAINETGEQFGLERIKTTLIKYKDLPVEKIKEKFIKDLYNFMGSNVPFDDITLMIIRQK